MGTRVFQTQIRTSVTVAEAPAHGLSIFDHAPSAKPSEDYKNFIQEVIHLTSPKASEGDKITWTEEVIKQRMS